MTSSEPKMRLWIFCPKMTLHDIPKMSQIGVERSQMIDAIPIFRISHDSVGHEIKIHKLYSLSDSLSGSELFQKMSNQNSPPWLMNHFF